MLRWFCVSTAILATSVVMPSFVSGEEDHEHEKGPHGGSLVELGDEEYHAEIVHDEKEGQVTIYILGADAKTAVGIEAKEVAVNSKVKGAGVQIKLKSVPQKKDKAGLSSRFASKDKELIELLDNPEASSVLRVSIKGKAYSGKIEHEEDHDEKSKAKKK